MSRSSVIMELWPYLLTFKNDERRVVFIQNVYNRKFNVDMLQLGREIRIRSPFDSDVKYYEFVVTHNGMVAENGIGYYIGLKFKNDHLALAADLKEFSKYYRFGGNGIVVPVDWIMLNLYTETDCQSETMKIGEMGAVPKTRRPSTETPIDANYTKPSNYNSEMKSINNSDMSMKNAEKRARWLSQAMVQPNEINETDVISNTSRSAVILCGAETKSLNYSNKIEFTNGDNGLVKNSEKRVQRPSPPIVPAEKISETTTILKTHCGSSETLCESKQTLNYAAEIEFINNVEGSVKNAEKSCCDLCDKIIEIGRGVILRECLHCFCTHCIRGHVAASSNYSEIKCPYNKEYQCNFNLLDAEIKDLGGDLVYNQILDYRLKEFVSTDPNVRACPKEDCKHIWFNSRIEHTNNQRCPKCGTNWCYICKSAHEPGKPHGHNLAKTGTDKAPECVNKRLLGTELGETTATCHEVDEVTKITGLEVLKLFLGSPNKQQKTADPIEKCYCKPPTSTCGFILNCEHQFCRTLLTGIVQEQLKNKSRAACPMCLDEIHKCQISRLVGQKIDDVIEKCLTCCNQVDVVLATCRHGFCHKCVHDLIKNQVSNPSKISINCSACNGLIIDSDIFQYGSEQMLALFKLKIETAKANQKPVEQISVNDSPFRCNLCEERILIKHGIILAQCKDFFCLVCCKEFIDQQLTNSQIPICPICQRELEQFEVEAVTGKTPDMANGSTILAECLKCEGKFEQHVIQKCSKCASSICLNCAKSTILDQIANNCPLKCPFCQNLVDESEIVRIQNATFKAQSPALELINLESDVPQPVVAMCVLCVKSTDAASLIVLTKCKHVMCRKCLHETMLGQMVWPSIPKCPLCMEPIDQIQLDAFEISTSSLSQKSRLEIFKMTDEFQIVNIESAVSAIQLEQKAIPFECVVCEKSADPDSQLVLTKCKHEICRKCLHDKILDQMESSSISKCPICMERIDQIELDALGLSVILSKHVAKLSQSQRSSMNISKVADEFQIVNTRSDASTIKSKRTVNHDDSDVPQLVEIPFECVVCEKTADPASQVVLTKCKHEICRKCLHDKILDQMESSSISKCPICMERIDQIELDALGLSVILSKHVAKLSPSQKSSTKISKVADEFQIFNIRSAASTIQLEQKANHDELDESQPIEIPFECVVCEKLADPECQIVLTKCKHEICRKCLHDKILDQMESSSISKCPICMERIDQIELDTLGLSVILSKHVAKLSQSQRSSMNISKVADEFQIVNTRSDASTIKPKRTVNHDDSDVPQLVEIPFECVVCEKPADPECQMVLTKCKHEICRKCLHDKILDQMESSSISKCPMCMERIDQIELDALGLSVILSKHVAKLSPSQKSSTKISKVADEFQIFNIRSAASTIQLEQKANQDELNVSQPIEIPFECVVCEKLADPECQMVLTKCKHEICRKCLHDKILDQMESSSISKCPMCMERIDQIELDALGLSVILSKHVAKLSQSQRSSTSFSKVADEFQIVNTRSDASTIKAERTVNHDDSDVPQLVEIPFECVVCEKPADPECQIVLTKCKHEICRKCLHDKILGQMESSSMPKCTICMERIDQIELDALGLSVIWSKHIPKLSQSQKSSTKISKVADEFQIVNTRSDASTLQLKRKASHNELDEPQPVEIPFECFMCEQTADRASQIVMAKCKHEVCRKCLQEKISDQMTWCSTPKCPICMEHIDPAQLDIIGIRLHCLERRHSFKKTRLDETVSDFNNKYFCRICQQIVDPETIFVLLFCADRFCRPCITTELNNQSLIERMPSCPLCSHEVAGSDVNKLCGMEGFRRYMDNKRNK